MCGITGIVRKNISKEDVLSILQRMNNCIIHRGPDDDGFFADQYCEKTIGFAMRRLAIIDLDSGKQPIYTEDESKVIVYNGEIYNYKFLKEKLQKKGVKFKTKSDTEVILKLYEYYGIAAFEMLDGMFAINIYDKILKKLFIARDYFGEKPLYYQHVDGGLIWASELKSIVGVLDNKPEIDPNGLALFFQLTYIPAPFTIYKGINKLEANHVLCYDMVSGAIKIAEITAKKPIERQDISFNEAKMEIHNRVRESVVSRSVSDVPLGTFLSGGVDSSIISLCLAQDMSEKINTFSIGFEKKSFDETDKSRIVSQLIGSNHQEFIISERDLTAYLDRILTNFDEPFADSSALPSYLVAKKTSEYVKVALTGDGGDEVFGGYNKYMMGKVNRRYTSLIPKILHGNIVKLSNLYTKQTEDMRGFKFQVKKALNSVDYGNDFYYNIIKLGFSEVDMTKYFVDMTVDASSLAYYQKKIPTPITLTDFREVDRMLSLEGDMIVKVDRTSMLNSLECRAPFLNQKLWDYTSSLPENFLINGNNKKFILKKAFEKYFPAQFLDKSKQGFGVPVGDWLREGLRKEIESYIDLKLLLKQNIFKPYLIIEMVKRHLDGIEDNSFKVWTFYCFQKWYLQNME